MPHDDSSHESASHTRTEFSKFKRFPSNPSPLAAGYPTTVAQPSKNVDAPPLEVNRSGPHPRVCAPYDARVASRLGFDRMVVTSPNMDWIPPYPRHRDVIETFADGRWGMYEYTRHPQDLARGMWHIACIPYWEPGMVAPLPEILWETLDEKRHWKEHPSIGFNGLGYIDDEAREALETAAEQAIDATEQSKAPPHVRNYADFLTMLLRQAVERMRQLPVVAGVAIAVAAHVQRLCLELAGLKTYVEVVVPRLESSDDFSSSVLPVIGTFVREGSDAANTTRVGLPTWFLRPHTCDIAVWKVTDARPMSSGLSEISSHPRIFHQCNRIVGVSNLTGNWQTTMALAISKHVAGTHLAAMSLAEVPQLLDGEQAAKRPRLGDAEIRAVHVVMPEAHTEPTTGHKKTRRGKRGKGKISQAHESEDSRRPALGAAVTSTAVASVSSMAAPHPSKSLHPSPFYSLAPAWEAALRAVSPIPTTKSSALYFYPPPFLLDTISSVAGLSDDCERPETARIDEKVARYLLNFVRVRDFLQTRLFDPSLTHDPLSIAEWRVVLWGDYQSKLVSAVPSSKPSEQRRAERRLSVQNSVSRLLSRVAGIESYCPDHKARYLRRNVNLDSITTEPFLRRQILWECHEINFRCELMALDSLLVHEPTWQEIHRWQRESAVTKVWASKPRSAVSVLTDHSSEDRIFRWSSISGVSDEHDEGVEDETYRKQASAARQTVKSLAQVMMRWPQCPESVVQAGRDLPDIDAAAFPQIQALVVDFYVHTFVKHFMRLPIPPIVYPERS